MDMLARPLGNTSSLPVPVLSVRARSDYGVELDL
jgi:hypothetical protein